MSWTLGLLSFSAAVPCLLFTDGPIWEAGARRSERQRERERKRQEKARSDGPGEGVGRLADSEVPVLRQLT